MKRVLNVGFFAAALAASAFISCAEDAPMTDEQILKDVHAPPEFDVTVFAKPPMANYPVFVAAAPDGTLYVASDGNGSLDRAQHRGRILRLRDTKGTGHADEVKEFVKDVDAPRGIVWDHDRVYAIHPPNLSCFIDTDGDGIADKEIVLVKNCGFTFKDRPADHTTNGLQLGPDGWLYVSQGDFGFMEAEGTDGRKLQFRGGGIWRVRPDGTGLEMYAYGSRNVVSAGLSPLLDLFARDNTNDGGGWDTRFHHFTGLEDHGYPRLFTNFSDEIVPRLADYGGGGACGSCYIDEPGFPVGYTPSHFSADWGRGEIYRHPETVDGATFKVGQESFIKMTRPTDLDVDGNSHVFVASWKGATFTWAGPNVGYIVRVTPKGYKPEPLPDFARATDVELVKLLLSPSAVRRLEAQRTLLRRGLRADVAKVLAALANDPSKPIASRVIALFTIKQGLGANATPTLVALSKEPGIRAWAIRALTDRWDQLDNVPTEPVLSALKDSNARTRKEAVVSVARLKHVENADALIPLLADEDHVVAHTAYQVMARLNAYAPCFRVLDDPNASPKARTNALFALERMHDATVVDGLITRLAKETDSARRRGIISALCRLDMHEGVWKGDSWGTRPDTRGPYYQPEAWEETPKIEKALSETLTTAQGEEASFMLTEFSRERINPGDSTARTIELAAKNDALLPVVVKQLSTAATIPGNAIPLLIKAASSEASADDIIANAVIGLSKTESADAFRAMLDGLAQLELEKRHNAKDAEHAREAFLNAAKLDQHVDLFAEVAAKMDGKKSIWADAALIKLASRKIGSPEPRDQSAKIIDAGWPDPQRRAQLIEAQGMGKIHYNDERLVAALDDKDKTVASAAHKAVGNLKLDPEKIRAAAKATGPKIGEMKIDDVLAEIMKTKGDASRGPQLFAQQGCIACHTTSKSEPLKGPYLGNIATVYRRHDLAENILLPNKTIAQGFATHTITLKDGTVQIGFVVREAADSVTIRNVAAQEISIPTANIAHREKLGKSLMPEGLVANLTIKDFASLLDYLEQLAKNEK